ncbi:MAG: hypothetical protein A2782_01015 [Candidatus Blackburnbacteria bacterium RIFCSPHIGHO2_01_FULL_43_15b]|uniref:Uncharacterized protein n=1 Tax=Candidatus Blackburnbacteria bacterium RIFCSPHIGHO2_01_FULL_43_15b TaxID=1797513 RepID=A0A1G1V0Z6_9BACT|nr:MAG: hypothetical protein A2782_01015 [Candidatus Blackburnbacteria bacterium RIFCSPHIGHO2_01_FULL_43_15b]
MLTSLRLHFVELFGKLSRFKIFFIVLPYLALAVLGFYFAYQRCAPTFVKDGVKYTRKSICGDIKTAETLPTPKNPNEKKVDAKVFTDSEANYWEIIDNSKSPNFPTGLKFSEKDLPSPTVVRWNNYLLGINIENYVEKSGGAFLGSPASEHYTLQSQIRTVRVYNIDTGETFDISLEKPTWGEIWYTTSQVVGNTYYFGVGGAFGASLGYKLDLPPQRSSRVTKLASPIGNEITKYGNTYVSSSCYEGCTYSLFNPASLTVTPLERMTSASNDRDSSRKEEFIGIDDQGRMILNVRNIPKGINNQQHFETEMLAASSLSNEGSTVTLINASDLPEKMKGYFMVDGIGKVLMFGNTKVYIYDLNQGQAREIQIGSKLKEDLSSAKSYNYYSATRTDEAVCFTDSESIKYAVDLVKETYLDTPPSDCKKLWAEKTKEEVFKELNLPDNFEFVYTPAVYKTYNVVKGMPESELPKDSEIIK